MFYIGNTPYLAIVIPLNLLSHATFVTLITFTKQKNAIENEVIGQGLSGDRHLCPVLSTVALVCNLRQHNAPPSTPLCAVYTSDTKSKPVTSGMLTTTIQTVVAQLGPENLGFLPSDVGARALRAAGAMALLCAHVDSDTIRLIGRWRSEEVLRYLHVQAAPLQCDYSHRMLAALDYSLLPNPAAIAAMH